MSNTIKIFEQEERDTVATAIRAQSSITMAHIAHKSDREIRDLTDQVEKSLASSNRDKSDLYYLDSVLVSTGWNKNDDVFLPDLTWAARNSPEDKQFNLLHNENTIIGHMIGSHVVNHSGIVLADDLQEIPKDFDIISHAVIYKTWQEASNQERMNKILAEIEEDKWFVSMECLFSNFHYAVISPEGESHLIERNETSAHLSKHLRSYGGEGVLDGYKIGRVLSGFAFSGKGLVPTPANPRSIILRSEASFNVKANDFTTNLTIGENQMDELKLQVEELKKELAAAKAESEASKKEAQAKKEQEVASLMKEKDSAIAELNTKVEEALSKLSDTQASLVEKASELEKVNESVAKMEKEKKNAKRKEDLIKAGFTDQGAEESVSLYEPLNDEAFAQVLAKFPDFLKKGDKDKKDDKKEDKKEDKSKADEEPEADAFKEAEDNAEASINTSDVDDSLVLRQGLASWIDTIFETENVKGNK